MPIFVNLLSSERKKLFENLKKNIKVSWANFYPKYNISRTMFFNYLAGRYDTPKNLFDKWNKIAKTNLENIKQIKKERYEQKNLPEIKLDEKLAEIFGVLNGDGHISKCGKEICIVCDSREKDYLDYLKKLFENKFGILFKFFCQPSKIKLRTYSVKLSKLLTQDYGLPKGNKLGKLKIPISIKGSKRLLISYLRGLFDTDGTIYKRRERDLVIEISSADKKFLDEIIESLKKLGFSVSKSKKHLSIYKKEEIIHFFRTIKPSNNKHLKKFNSYIKNKRG